VKTWSTVLFSLGLLAACVTHQPDHFYILSPQPPAPGEARATSMSQATLRVTLPSLVDRPEMIVNTSADGVIVLEHERWAAPLADLVTQTLAQDIERRRRDVLFTGQSVSHSGAAAVKVSVDVTQIIVRRGERASVDAHWRILDVRTGKDVVGGEVFSQPLVADGYSAVAEALSGCLGLLADRLAAQMP
jgi:uncharacterized lipoprotein YmbA